MLYLQDIEREIEKVITCPPSHLGNHQSNIGLVNQQVLAIAIMNLINRVEQEFDSKLESQRRFYEQNLEDKLREFYSKCSFDKFSHNVK